MRYKYGLKMLGDIFYETSFLRTCYPVYVSSQVKARGYMDSAAQGILQSANGHQMLIWQRVTALVDSVIPERWDGIIFRQQPHFLVS